MNDKVRASTKVAPAIGPIIGPAITGLTPINRNPDNTPGQMKVGDPRSNSQSPPAGHLSTAVRSELGKLEPSLAASIRTAAK